MKKIDYRFWILFSLAAVMVFASAVILKGRQAIAPGVPIGANSADIDAGSSTPDSISTSASSDGDIVVSDATADYHFSMPSNWYLEKNIGTSITVYPDYDPKSGDAPECKIELSMLAGTANGGASFDDLSSWLTQYLHTDPTASVMEISRTPLTIGAAAGDSTNSAVEWRGTLNSVTTTLVYVAMPSATSAAPAAGTNGKILEIAPSTLSEASDADNDECNFDLEALVANLNFGAYEP